MRNTNNRSVTRCKVCTDTQVTVNVSEAFDHGNWSFTVKGTIKDIGERGLFLMTPEVVPVPAKGKITIDFEPGSPSDNFKIRALGETVHATNEGVGIRFTYVNLPKLQQCIVSKMNKTIN